MSVRTTEWADPFGTARLRRGVLDAWGASPARFREDANAEEDLVLGGYRDRLVVELAQNAADAAARAGTAGRLRLTLHPGTGDAPPVLAAANTGAALDATGVESLSTLRASAKRDSGESAVGRFGVGFAAVLAVSDEPAVIGRHGGVRWSLAEARGLAEEAAQASPGLGDELRRRDGHVPLLRLPLPAEGTAPEGYDTVVVLPLRDGAAADLVERLLAGVDDALLLTLPGLAEIVIETPEGVRELRRTVQGPYVHVQDSAHGERRWRVVSHGGGLAPALLADRPVEERLRPHWAVTWAVPVDDEGAPARPRTAPVVHAPTPTDEPLGVPALLIATLPLDTTRRHPAPGPLTDFLVERAAQAYAELLGDWQPVTVGTIDLVPGPLGKGELDGALRAAILRLLPRTAFLEAAAPRDVAGEWSGRDDTGLPVGESSAGLRPIEAEVLEGAGAETVQVLAEVLPSLLPAGLERRVELRTLGVARVPLTEAIDRLAGLEREPDWWRRLYDSLAGVDPDRLTGLPVPLADSRTTIGPRQTLLPLADTPQELARLGLKVVHPDAAHPLLEKLGALPATPRAVLTTPQVRAAVAGSMDAGEMWDEDALDADEVVQTVLTLVRDAGLEPGDEPWLGALALPDEDGELAPAGELVLPGSPFASVMRDDELALCDAELAERWGEQPLAACGVLANFALVRATDVVLDPDELEPRDGDFAEPDDAGLLDAVDVWCEDVLDRLPDTPVPPVATEIVAVRDLDLVDDDRWPQALALLAQPPLRDALTQAVRVLLPDGTTETVRPYTAWWLRDHPVLDGRRPGRAAGRGRRSAARRAVRGRRRDRLRRRAGAAGAGRTDVGGVPHRRAGRCGRAARPPRGPRPAGAAGPTARALHGAGGARPGAGDAAGRASRGGGRRGPGGRRVRRCRGRRPRPPPAHRRYPAAAGGSVPGGGAGGAVPGTPPERDGGGGGHDRGRGVRGPRVGARPAGRGHPGHVHRARRTDRGRHRTGMAPHPGRGDPRVHGGGRGGGPRVGGGPVAAPLRGGGAAGGLVAHGRTGPEPLVRLRRRQADTRGRGHARRGAPGQGAPFSRTTSFVFLADVHEDDR